MAAGVRSFVPLAAALLVAAGPAAGRQPTPRPAATPTATATTLTLSATAVDAGKPVTLTAQVTSGATRVAPGIVHFCNAAWATCAGPGLLGTAILNSQGTAARVFVLPAGSYSVYVQFDGTSPYAASNSVPQSLTVTGASTYSTKAILTNVTGSKGAYSVGASLTSHAPAPPTGSLVLKDVTDAKTLGTVALPPTPLGGYQPFGLISTGSKSSPNDLAIGDFNNDGIPDIAVPDSATGVVAVLLGKGDGTFAPAVTYSTGTGSKPLTIAVGDLNGDGNPDLVVALGNQAAVAVLLGTGKGTFQAAQTWVTAGSSLYYPIAVVLADFNRDGRLDIATVNNSQGASLLVGNGDGTFQGFRSLATDKLPTWIAAGDLDNDGNLDLVVPTASDTVDILLGNGDGSFQKYTPIDIGSGTSPESVAVADLDGDGNLDLAVACYGANAFGVLLGNGDGTFQPIELYGGGSGPISVSVADLNLDGIPDAIVTDLTGNGITLFQGNGDGTYLPLPGYSTTPRSLPAATVAADLDSSGTPELVSVLYGSSAIYILQPGRVQGVHLKGVTLPTAGTINLTASYAGDGLYAASTSTPYQFTGSSTTAVAPAFSPAAGSYTTAQTVTLSSTTKNAAIHYTLDGTTPTASSKLYTDPLQVTLSETISAIAVASGFTNSSVATATYVIETPAAAPSFSPPAGSYTGSRAVTLATSTPKATIYYTLNGSTPTHNSPQYTAPLTVSSNATISALASAPGYSDSTVATATYTITQPTLALAASPKSPTAGQSAKLTATLTAPNATDIAAVWTVKDGAKTLCSASQTQQTSYACTAKLAKGAHSLTASYAGKTNGWKLAASLSLTVQ